MYVALCNRGCCVRKFRVTVMPVWSLLIRLLRVSSATCDANVWLIAVKVAKWHTGNNSKGLCAIRCGKLQNRPTIAKARAHLVQGELRISHQSLIHCCTTYKSGIMERLTLTHRSSVLCVRPKANSTIQPTLLSAGYCVQCFVIFNYVWFMFIPRLLLYGETDSDITVPLCYLSDLKQILQSSQLGH